MLWQNNLIFKIFLVQLSINSCVWIKLSSSWMKFVERNLFWWKVTFEQMTDETFSASFICPKNNNSIVIKNIPKGTTAEEMINQLNKTALVKKNYSTNIQLSQNEKLIPPKTEISEGSYYIVPNKFAQLALELFYMILCCCLIALPIYLKIFRKYSTQKIFLIILYELLGYAYITRFFVKPPKFLFESIQGSKLFEIICLFFSSLMPNFLLESVLLDNQ